MSQAKVELTVGGLEIWVELEEQTLHKAWNEGTRRDEEIVCLRRNGIFADSIAEANCLELLLQHLLIHPLKLLKFLPSWCPPSKICAEL